jgi:flagellar M-ring protein FliF
MVAQDTEEEVVNQIRDAVGAAIGFDATRGDVLNVTAVNFDRSLEEAAQAAMQAQADAARRRMYIYAGLIILVLLLTSALIIYLYRKKPAPAAEENIDFTVEEDQEELELFEPNQEQKMQAQVKTELENMIHSDPENAAKLIRSWLGDE